MKCLGCKGRFKNETGLLPHLSKKPLCQNAMGIVVPPIRPPIQTFALASPPNNIQPTKKRPAPPHLPHGLNFPTSVKGQKTYTPSAKDAAMDSDDPTTFTRMDSHVLHSMLTTLLTNKTVVYDNMLRTAHPDLSGAGYSTHKTNDFSFDVDIDDDDIEDNQPTTAFDGNGKDVNEPFNNPFANDFFEAPNAANTEPVFHETDTAFADRFDGAFSHAEKLSIRLLSILRCIGAPNYVYGKIMNIIEDALGHNVFLTSTFFWFCWFSGFVWV
jgi:hypothetical protein